MTQFSLTDDQIAIRDMALAFAAENLAPHALEWDEKKHFPVDVMREAAALGMAAIYTRDDVGGSGMTRLDAALIFEALATGCPPISAYLSIHNMVAWMIDRYGSDEQRQRYIPKLVTMELIASYCLTEPGSGSDAAALKTKAVREGDHYIVNGVKQFISGAGASDFYVTMVRTGEDGPSGISTLVIEKDTPGVSFGAQEKKMGWNAQPTAAVIFEDARVPVANLLVRRGHGLQDRHVRPRWRAHQYRRLLARRRAIAPSTRRWLMRNDRKAFGKRIADFQALQFKLADMATELEGARTLLWRAAAALDAKALDATRLCAMAKRMATDPGLQGRNDALQIHGGYGYLADYGIEKIVRDLRVHQILEGTNEIMRLIVARDLVGRGNR